MSMPPAISHREFYPNGYGISLISHEYSYGLELAVLKGNEESSHLCYDTPITSDVLTHLTIKDLYEICKRVKMLPSCIKRKTVKAPVRFITKTDEEFIKEAREKE